MGKKNQIKRRICRYSSAALASAVTTFIAFEGLAWAGPTDCGLQDVMAWQIELKNHDIEQTPAYRLSVTEAFLEACPNRPEFADASRIAGIAAADNGEANRAADHFRGALPMQDMVSNFYAIASFAATGDTKAAWRVRDRMVERWHTRLERHPHVSVSAEPTDYGMVYQLYFTKVDRDAGIQAAWIGVPDGPGWPATLTFSKDRLRLGLRKIRASESQEDFRYVDLHRCLGRRTLGKLPNSLSSTDFDEAARASLIAYLANPDVPETPGSGGILNCAFPARLLPSPPKP